MSAPGTTAKERRLARREAERLEKDSSNKATIPSEVAPAIDTGASTAKDRRLAKRAALRAATEADHGVSSSSASAEAPALEKKKKKHLVQRKSAAEKKMKAEQAKAEGAPKKKSAAQLRRIAARASARGEEVPLAGAAASQPTAVTEAKLTEMNAKERRLAKRAMSRESGDVDETLAPAPEADGSTMNARERRLARRVAERNGEEVDPAAAKRKASSMVAPTEWGESEHTKIPNVVFVGQLPYSATEDDIRDHFTKGLEIPASDMKVRLLTKKAEDGTSKSRGMAFVEFSDAEQQHLALTLHRSYFGTGEGQRRRQINVEKTAGGGKDVKKARVEEARQGQETHMKSTVSRIIEDYVSKGFVAGLREVLDGDKYLHNMLLRCDASTVDLALAEFQERNLEDLTNPAAYLTALVCRFLAEGSDAKVAAAAKRESEKRQENSGGYNSGKSSTPTYGKSAEAPSAAAADVPLERRFPSLATRGGRGGQARR